MRNELLLIKQLLPIWKKYADGFVFMLDNTDDGSEEYLNEVKEEYNILEIININIDVSRELNFETNNRQRLFDAGLKYSDKIICLDADEYLDGTFTKSELEDLLDNNPNTLFYLRWVQYTSINTIRTDGPWNVNFKDRIGKYTTPHQFIKTQTHATHLPIPSNSKVIDPNVLFISHLQWLDKNYVAIKQYYWKLIDYINNKKYGVDVVGNQAYDESVNNFDWTEEYFDFPLQINPNIFEDVLNKDNYKIQFIQDNAAKYNAPNLGDWGYNILDSVPMYFCTAADEKHFPLVINLIGSIHKHNYYDTVEIRVYDLGFTKEQRNELSHIKKVKVCDVEKVNDKVTEPIQIQDGRFLRGLFSWKPVVIKDALDHFDYVLYVDAGTTIKKPLNGLFKHIIQNDYILFDCGHSIKWMTTKKVINEFNLTVDDSWILNDDVFGIDAGFQGFTRKMYDSYILPAYEYSKNLDLFVDDGSCPNGFGCGRYDQTIYSILARKLGLDIQTHGNPEKPAFITVDGNKISFELVHSPKLLTENTNIFRSRWNLNYQIVKDNTQWIKRRYIISVITAVGKLDKYEKFIDVYFNNIQTQVGFNMIEFIIVYVEWSDIFNNYSGFKNIKFIKDDAPNGVYNAWNIGIINSTAEYITNWNIDDIRFDINNVIKYDLLKNNIDVDLAYNYYVGYKENEVGIIPIEDKVPIKYPDNFHLYVTSMCMAGPDPMWRKLAHMFIGLFDYDKYSIIGDWEMWIRMAKYGLTMRLIPLVLCAYVEHSNTVSNQYSIDAEKQKTKLLQKYS